MALSQKYDKYVLDGVSSLYLKPPVIYISDAGQAVDCFHVCSRLGLPMSSISFVPCNTVFGSQHSMDVAALDKQINDDLTEGKVPVMVIAYAGNACTACTSRTCLKAVAQSCLDFTALIERSLCGLEPWSSRYSHLQQKKFHTFSLSKLPYTAVYLVTNW